MKRSWVEYREEPFAGPMTFWVHRETDGRPWHLAESFDPPRPGPVPGRCYARFLVEVDGIVFEFASLAEIRHSVEVLSAKNLPSTLRLTEERGAARGPNSHWLSRLPAKAKSWRYRKKAVAALLAALAEFEEEINRR